MFLLKISAVPFGHITKKVMSGCDLPVWCLLSKNSVPMHLFGFHPCPRSSFALLTIIPSSEHLFSSCSSLAYSHYHLCLASTPVFTVHLLSFSLLFQVSLFSPILRVLSNLICC